MIASSASRLLVSCLSCCWLLCGCVQAGRNLLNPPTEQDLQQINNQVWVCDFSAEAPTDAVPNERVIWLIRENEIRDLQGRPWSWEFDGTVLDVQRAYVANGQQTVDRFRWRPQKDAGYSQLRDQSSRITGKDVRQLRGTVIRRDDATTLLTPLRSTGRQHLSAVEGIWEITELQFSTAPAGRIDALSSLKFRIEKDSDRVRQLKADDSVLRDWFYTVERIPVDEQQDATGFQVSLATDIETPIEEGDCAGEIILSTVGLRWTASASILAMPRAADSATVPLEGSFMEAVRSQQCLREFNFGTIQASAVREAVPPPASPAQ